MAAVLLLAGCSTATPRTNLRQPATQSVQPVPVERDLPLQLIGAELALQRNDLADAARRYAQAASLSSDPAVAEQATRLALAVKDWAQARESLQRWQQLAPRARGIVQARAWVALGEGNEEDAKVELDRLVGASDPGGWRALAQVLVGMDDKGRAAGLLARTATPERLGKDEAHWLAMSQLALRLGDKALSARLADSALARFRSAETYAWSAQLALDRGDKALARRQYAEALKRDPASLRLRTGYAALLGDSGDNAGAARALATGEQNDMTYGARAAYAARADDKALLEALYREIGRSDGRSPKRLMLLGQIAEILERPREAIDWYREVPEGSERWFDAGTRIVVLNDKAGNAQASRERLSELRASAGASAEEAGDLYLLEAELLIGKSRQADATAVYTRGLDQFPGDARLLYARAMLAIDQNDLAAAERDLRQLIDEDPGNADALNALGYTLADRTQRFEEAADLIGRALALKPDEPAIIDSFGWVQYRLGHLEEARKQLSRAYEKNQDAEIAAHYGEILWAMGERNEARRIWEEGRRKDPDNKVLIDTVRRLAP